MLAFNVENIKIAATVFLIADMSTESRLGDKCFCNIDDTLQTLKLECCNYPFLFLYG